MDQDRPHPGATYRNLVLFSDGTGNSAAKLFRTNVWRTYQAVDLADPLHEAHPIQYAFYDEGVGTSPLRPLALLGGAIGLGLGQNVRDLYAFVCRTYRPGDKIYAFGFSRGAFTIRVLMGLILNQGIVEYNGDEAALKRNVAAAYRRYRRLRYTNTQGLVPVIRAVRDWFIDGWHGIRHGVTYDGVPKLGAPAEYRGPWTGGAAQRPEQDRPIEIEFAGLWDTVDAYGLPVDELTRAIDWLVWPLSMPDQKLNGRVRRAMHALALDDERNTFHPRLWHEDETDMYLVPPDPLAPSLPFPVRSFPYFPSPDGQDGETRQSSGVPGPATPARDGDSEWPTPLARPRISQVWFAGVHANVGGGYPDDTLSHVPLIWILRGARDAGLRLVPNAVAAYGALADENGPIYDSRRGLAAYYRYNPRRISALVEKSGIELRGINVHESAFERIRKGLDGYAPIVIPTALPPSKTDGHVAGLRVVMKDESVRPARDHAHPCEGEFDRLDERTERVWNTVWRRRVAYFWTLFATLVLAVFPLILSVNPDGACRSPFCFVAEPITAVGSLLPGFARPWIDVFASNPGWFLVVALAVAFGYRRGGVLAQAIGDRMRPAWYAIRPLRPRGLGKPEQPAAPSADAFIQRLRLSAGYKAFYRGLTVYVLPFLFVLGILYAAVAASNQVGLTVAESAGFTCGPGPGPAGPTFRTSSFCHPTGIAMERDATYLVAVEIGEAWLDDTIASGPNGLSPNDVPPRMTLGVPLRRHLAQPWHKLMLRIGETGTDTYAPAWKRVVAPGGPTNRYEAVVKARSAGELYAYVNDAVLFPVSRSCFYGNNRGSATVSVVRAEAGGGA
ncbi:T6SS phospholipase effector Tle1-like catalytic domain-containing protein [Enterovirga aerilata]|uniref:DUF2235 domain-containing protein n=1 Tax=Enterovirga aerilata TaxID=2730920 RepID=A0A849I9B0_9HYPH|nr:DUF2235 domain-containing protein [Enterovirga sp. DB1703]NNM72587.1 DUF2235 domain-containing protein [Enterovirga sp. DB1703]